MPKQATPVVLSKQGEQGLLQIIRRHRSEQQVVLRARIVLAAALRVYPAWDAVLVSQFRCGQRSGYRSIHDPTHQVVFYYTPKHASWMKQVKILLRILVRKILKCGNFTSLDDLCDQILAFIDSYNRTMAKPIK